MSNVRLALDPKYFDRLVGHERILPMGQQQAVLVRVACESFELEGPVELPAPGRFISSYIGTQTEKRLLAVRAAHPGIPLARVIRALLDRIPK